MNVIQSQFNKQPNPAKFKTSICKFFLEGSCTRGDSCTWSHGEDGGAAMMQSMMGGMMGGKGGYGGGKGGWGGGKGGGGGMAVMSEDPTVRNYKKTPCRFFMLGQCGKGDACTFSHGEGTGGGAAAAAPWAAAAAAPWTAGGGGSSYGKTPCKFFAMGTCTKGAACTFSHDGGSAGGWSGGKGGKGKGGGMMEMMMSMMGGKGGGMKGMMMSMMGKGKGKGKTGNKGKGHLLPRTRISEAPFLGTVAEWKGKFGWIQPAETIEHAKAAKNGGKLFVGMDDCPEGGLVVGTTVSFHIWEDSSGLGADEITLQ